MCIRDREWAGYPEIKTLDQYFDLLESYADANPTMANGTKNIPYTTLFRSRLEFQCRKDGIPTAAP